MVNTLVPTFTREELLNKNIVEFRRPNEDVEMGYSFVFDNLDVLFIDDASAFELFMSLSPKLRDKFLTKEYVTFEKNKEVDTKRLISSYDTFAEKHGNELMEITLEYLADTHYKGDVAEFLRDYLRKYPIGKIVNLEGFSLERLKTLFLYEEPNSSFQENLDKLISEKDRLPLLFKTVANVIKAQDADISSFFEKVNLECPFDEVVVKHYSRIDNRFEEIYTYIKVEDRQRNLIKMERYLYTRMPVKTWSMIAKGTYVIGHDIKEAKVALRRSIKTTTIDPMYDAHDVEKNVEMYLPFDFLSLIYGWYKTIENREVVVREITSKVAKEETVKKSKSSYVSNATKDKRRVIDLGRNLVVYTRDETAVKNIKKRKPTWHVDSFYRRGTDECHYHRKDGTITVYSRKGTTVRPKKNKDNNNQAGVTYVIK